jgi:translocation and assembly module TamB
VSKPATRPRCWWKYALIVTGVCIITIVAALWYLTTESFQAYVRRRVVAEIERITGGHAQAGSFHIVPFHMQLEVRDITVRGSESASDVPLFHADHLYAHVKIISFLRTEFGFHSLSLEHPVIHIVIDPDGTTNIPASKVLQKTVQGNPVEKLFALSINSLSVHDGELLWGDQKIPLDFSVRDTAMQMDYSYLRGRYECRFTVGKADTAVQDYRPFSWATMMDLSFGPTFADIKSLRWNSGRSHLEASGRISDFHNPHLDGTYDAHVDLEEAAAITRRRDLREGVAEFRGSGHWSLEDFTTAGYLALHDVDWQSDQFAVKKANVTTDFSVTDQEVRFYKTQGKMLGGSFAADAQIDNWLHSIPPVLVGKAQKGKENMAVITAARPKRGPRQKSPGVQTGVVHVRFRDVAAGDLVTAVNLSGQRSAPFRPLGLATGTVDASWRGSVRDAELAFAFEAVPPPIVPAAALAINARVQGKYSAATDSLELSQFNLSTPESRVVAQGSLSESSALHLSVATTDLDEWRPLIVELGGPVDVPFQVDGSAGFNGVIGGTFSAPTLAGTLAVQDFEFTVPATSYTPERQVKWDSLTASVQVSSHEAALHGGSLRRGDTTADFDVSAVLQKWQFADSSPLNARVSLHHVDVASTAALAGFDRPVSGTADITLQIAGTRGNPQAQGHIHANNAAAYGESIEKFDADLHMTGGETALSNIQLTHQDAAMSGSAAYTPASHRFQLDLGGTNFDLARIRWIQRKELLLEGRGDFTLRASGTFNSPSIQGNVHIRDLTLDHERSGGLYIDAVTHQDVLHVTVHSELVRGAVTVDGDVQMHGDFPATMTAHVDHVDLDALWNSFLWRNQLTGHSASSGTVILKGPMRHPSRWTLDGEMNDIAVDFENAKLHNQGPVRFTYGDETIHIAPTHMVGEGTDVTGHGSIAFGGAQDIDLSADGQIELKLLSSINSDFTASGQMLIHLNLGGTLDEPLPIGTVRINNGTVNYAGLPSGLSEMNGSLAFTRDRIRIEQLAARTGGGTIDLRGDATLYNRQANFNLTAIGKDVRLRYPPGVSSTANAELHWVGNRAESTVSGDILVTKLAVTPGFDFGSYLERSRQAVALGPANSPLYNIKLDVAVRTAPELQMKTAVARLSGDADLRLRGSVARPSVLGRADILEGDATFNGIKFRLERGDITFANPVAIEPQVNLQATTHVRNYDLDVTVTGTPDRLNVNYRSEPPLPKSDIIALLALGRTGDESAQLQQQPGQGPFTDEASALIINQAINQTVSSRLQRLFGASRIKIDPQGLTTETNPLARGPQVTIEQQFANNVTLTYSTNVSQSTEQIIQGEYFFNRNISAVGLRDQNGVVSFDVRIRQRKK